jgi:hypothetical protein
MTVDLKAKIEEFVKANRKVWPEWPKEKPYRRPYRSRKKRNRNQVYWVYDNYDTVALMRGLEILEIDDIMYIEPYIEEVEDCWYTHRGMVGKEEGIRLINITKEQAEHYWKRRCCKDFAYTMDNDE